MRTLRFRFLAALLLAGPVLLSALPPATPEAMNRLYTAFWDEYLAQAPFYATFYGDNRFNDSFGETDPAKVRTATRELSGKYLAQLAAVDPSGLPAEDRISYDLFRYQRQEALDELAFPGELLPLNQFSSMHLLLAQFGSGRLAQPFATVADYDAWLQRASAIPAWADATIASLREGLARRIVLPKVLARAVLAQLASLGAPDLEKSVFLGPVRNFPENFPAAERERLTAAYTAFVRDRILPAYQKLHAFVRDDYLPGCRDTVGLGDLPGGAEWYAFLARKETTTTLTPEEIHRIGLAEVARIRGQMEEAMRALGFQGTLKEFYAKLNEDPALRFRTREEIQAAYEGLRARIEARVPEFFGRTPRIPYEIRPVEAFREAGAAPAQYFSGLPDGSRPGIFYYNAYKPETRTRFSTEAFFVHEAVPGHHFEVSLAQEQTGLPAFRRFGGTGAYSEGWGLYCERLGREMGLYTDPYQWVGRLSAEIWRACRLVIDTGLHAKGWTREQGIAYFLDNTPQSEVVATQEVERYIAIPGQALSYKIGELKIVGLRQRAEQELGARFRLKDFHDEVLAHGSVPLDVLEAAVNRWIAAQRH